MSYAMIMYVLWSAYVGSIQIKYNLFIYSY